MFDAFGSMRLAQDCDSEASTQGRSQNFVLLLIISAVMLAAVGLTLVWLNIERTKLAYRMRVLQHEADERVDLNAKLSVERESLLSPRELGKKAELMGLGPAKTGQIRRMDERASLPAGVQGTRPAGAKNKE